MEAKKIDAQEEKCVGRYECNEHKKDIFDNTYL
jgi:hypothetical protein